MKYQSELIEEIVDARGHKESSLHYESECVETWIKEAKGAYPKLCDYESEWLNYITELDDTGGSEDPEPPIGEFPYVVLSDVTEATIDNVVPYAYKSAILKGNTLSAIPLSVIGQVESTINDDNSVTMIGDGGWHHVDYESSNYVGNKATFVVLFSENTIGDDLSYFQFRGFNIENKVINTNSFKWYGTITDECIRFGLNASVQSGSVTFRVMLLDGDYSNRDVPYFEGIKSVKMPALKTTGKNLYNKSPFNGYIDASSGKFVRGSTTRKISDYIEVEPNKKYKVSGCTMTTMWGYDKDKNPISVINIHDITTTSDMRFIAFTINAEVEHSNIQLEEGIVATSYEPYKSNILTANEDVTLRSNGSVCDELDLLTGKLTQRIDEDGEILAQEVVKTVDLNIQDQDGKTLSVIKPIEGKMYLSTSSNTIKPLFSGEIPVEAITQNLASFIDLEMEE